MVRQLPAPKGDRVETGPTQFGSDWKGLFIRGDRCVELQMILKDYISNHNTAEILKMNAQSYLDLVNEVLKNEPNK